MQVWGGGAQVVPQLERGGAQQAGHHRHGGGGRHHGGRAGHVRRDRWLVGGQVETKEGPGSKGLGQL